MLYYRCLNAYPPIGAFSSHPGEGKGGEWMNAFATNQQRNCPLVLSGVPALPYVNVPCCVVVIICVQQNAHELSACLTYCTELMHW